jgi:hypothetical protein
MASAIQIQMKKLTPVLIVDEIEPCVDFWVERLGFAKTVEVPEGEKLGFVILVKDGVEIMYQSRASALNDVPAIGAASSSSNLYIEVAALEPILERLGGVPVVVPRRKAPYGADEIFVREPGGNVIGFAAH